MATSNLVSHLGSLPQLITDRGLWPAILIAIAVVGGFYFSSNSKSRKLRHIPILASELGTRGRKKAFRWQAKQFLERGYREFNKKGKAFQVLLTEGPAVVLNARQAEEVGAMPDHIVDNMRPNGRALMDHYTGYLDADSVIYRIIRTQLSTRLGELGDILADQTDKCLKSELPPCKEWTKVEIYPRVCRIVASISTRIFLGEELASDEEWLQTTIGYTEQLIICATVLKHIPSFLVPLVYRLVPPYRKLRRTNDTAVRLIKPIVQARREAMEKPGFVGSDDIMQWMLNERVKKSFGDKDYVMMAQFQLQLSFAAVHTTSMALVNMLFDLIAYPENLAILREEVNENLAKNDGSFKGNFVKSLEKVDSFMKESQRHNPVGYTIMGRDICEDITLSDGTFLPKGTFITANSFQITHDSDILKSDSDPNIFDGLRYYNMRNKLTKNGINEKEVAGKHQFVSVSNSSWMFGYGKHACPGRFFAGNEIKLILAKFITTFDVKMPEGVKGRYESKSFEMANYPDTANTIMMKRIKV